jgi:hypothetical protein
MIKEKRPMLGLILVFLLAGVLFGISFALEWLFVVAAMLAVVWLVGFAARGPEARWYRR